MLSNFLVFHTFVSASLRPVTFLLLIFFQYCIKFFLLKLSDKARWELHKNATCCFEQILEAMSHKTAAARLLTSCHISRRTRHLGRKNELVSDVLFWTHTHGRANVGCPALCRHWIHTREPASSDRR